MPKSNVESVPEAEVIKAYRQALAHAAKWAKKFGTDEAAEKLHDAATDAVVKALGKFDPGRGVPFGGFCRPVVADQVKRAMSRLVAEAARRPAVRGFADGFDPPCRPAAHPDDPDAYEGFADLPPGLRAVATLYHIEGLTQAEVAARLGITQQAVSLRLADAADHLAGDL